MRPLLLLTLLLAGCSAKPDDSQPLEHRDANAGGAEDTLRDAREAEEDEFEDRQAAQAPKALSFKEVTIGPEEPRIDDVLEAYAELREGASPFAEVEFTWIVNGREVLGVSDDTLDKRKGRFKKLDRVKVVATATDEQGGVAERSSGEILIANSTPQIITDISGQSGLNGLRLKAEDADGDELSWSILEGPPGVSIDRRGTLRVVQKNMAEAWSGEVVIAAEDPDGARSEIHIPVTINAATEATREERVVRERRGRNDGKLEDYEKANEDAMKRMENMSDAEFKKYMDDQEKNSAD